MVQTGTLEPKPEGGASAESKSGREEWDAGWSGTVPSFLKQSTLSCMYNKTWSNTFNFVTATELKLGFKKKNT
jgi:hypothetical protein